MAEGQKSSSLMGKGKGKGAKKPPPSFSQPHMKTVTVHIGKEKVPFLLHKAFLIHYSPYFEKVLTGNFKEVSTGIIHLEHTTTGAFILCVEWIMTQQIQDTHIEKPLSSSIEERTAEEKLQDSDLMELWILADYLGTPDLQNKAIDMLAARLERLNMASGEHRLIYEHTLPGSMLRKLHVDSWSWDQSRDFEKNLHRADMPKGMLMDMAVVLVSRINNPTKPDPLRNSKNYHVAAMP